MKRGGFLQRRTPLKAKTPLKTSGKPLRRSALRKVSKDDVSQCKARLQSILREIVILRDGGCVLRHYPEAGVCGGYRKDGELILQGEHLNTRSRNVSYAEPRNLVCLCQHHHIHFKPQYSQLYWELIERHIGKERWDFYKRMRDDQRTYHMTLWDWQKEELMLTQELQILKQQHANENSVQNE